MNFFSRIVSVFLFLSLSLKIETCFLNNVTFKSGATLVAYSSLWGFVYYLSKKLSKNNQGDLISERDLLPGKNIKRLMQIDEILECEFTLKDLLSLYSVSREQLDLQKKEVENQGDPLKGAKVFLNSSLSDDVKRMLQTICGDFGFNAEELYIKPPFCSGSLACANSKNCISVGKGIYSYSLQAQRFILAHEIQHCLMCDVEYEAAFMQVLQQKLKDEQKPPLVNVVNDHPINKWRRFRELCADLRVATKNKSYAQCYLAFVSEFIKKGGCEDATHPSNRLRLAVAEALLQSFDQYLV